MEAEFIACLVFTSHPALILVEFALPRGVVVLVGVAGVVPIQPLALHLEHL